MSLTISAERPVLMPPAPRSNQQQIERLILHAHNPCIALRTYEESYALELIRCAMLGAQQPLLVWNVVQGLQEGVLEDGSPVLSTENPAAALYHLAHRCDGPTVCVMLDLGPHLSDERTLRALRDAIGCMRQRGGSLVLIDHDDKLPPVIAAEAARIEIPLPDEGDLDRLVRSTLKRLHSQKPLNIRLNKRELQTFLRNLQGLTRHQAEQVIVDCVAVDRVLDADDINTALAEKRRMLQEAGGVLEYIQAPIDLSAIGGLNNLKRWLKQRRDSLSDEAVKFGLCAPRGVLLLGVQGAGKSLSAKAIATAWQRPLLRLDPGTLYDRYVGESERRLRQALEQAERMAPIVLWIDEIEKGFASAAAHSTDGGLSQRMFGTLLTWMQDHRAPVFLVATANNIDALPPELLRKGRFDEIFFVDLPDRNVRKQIFAIHLAGRQRDPARFDLSALADAAEGFSGAEIEQAIVSAMHDSFADGADLDTNRLLGAIRESPPLAVTMAERVEALRSWARGRCVPAD